MGPMRSLLVGASCKSRTLISTFVAMVLISKSIVILATYILGLDYVVAHILDSINPSIILAVSLFMGLNERKKVTKTLNTIEKIN
jgi:hypothetical protein